MLNRRAFLGAGTAAAIGSRVLYADLKVPKPASELVLTLNSGEQILLSRLKGKIVVLEFLLTTCPHCQRCSQVMQKLFAEMGGEKAFLPLGAAVNPKSMFEARMMIPQYVYSLGLKYPVAWVNNDMAYQWLEANPAAGPVYFPQLVFIDKKGIIRSYHPGTDEAFFKDEETNIRKVIENLMKDGAGAPPKK